MSTQPLPIPFGALNEGDDPKALPPGTMLRNLNCAMDKARRLVKRDGTESTAKTRTDTGTVDAGVRLLTRGTGLGVTDGTTAFGYVSALSKWRPLAKIPNLRATRRPLVQATTSVGDCDIAITGDLLVTVYESRPSSGYWFIYVKIESVSTGDTLMASTEVTPSGVHPRVLINDAGTLAYITYSKSTRIQTRKLDLSTFSLGTTNDIITDNLAGTSFDACLGTSSIGDVMYVAYNLTSGTDKIQITSFAVPALTVEVAATPYAGASAIAFCLAYGALSTRVYLTYAITSHTKIITATKDLGVLYGPSELFAARAIHTFVVEHDASYPLVGMDVSGCLTSLLWDPAGAAAVAASTRTTWGLSKPHKPWKTNGRWFTAAVAQSALPSSVVVELETAVTLASTSLDPHPHVATLENQTGWAWSDHVAPFGSHIAQTAVGDDGARYAIAAYRTREPEGGDLGSIGWNLYRLVEVEGDTFRAGSVGLASLCAGGAPVWYDGASAFPYGFVFAPQIYSITASNNGGIIVAGDYSYVAVYVWRDNNGLLHRSPASAPQVGTTSGSNLTLDIVVSTSSLSNKVSPALGYANPVLIEIYRTTVGATGPHYRLTFEPIHNVLLSDPTVQTVTLRDTRADADITGADSVPLNTQQQLYTDTGELDDVPPPAFVTCSTHRGRLAGIGPDLRTVWLSKDSTLDATIAPGFNEALTLAFASDKTALASLDEKLIVFGRNDIDVVFGDGPADDGSANTWQIQRIQVDVGCTNPRCVVTSPSGVMFQSVRGIETLTRDLTVIWTGEAVVDTLDSYPTITSAVLVAEASEVRFTCHNGATGIVLAWNYHQKTWFTRAYADAATDDGSTSVLFVDAALIDGVYTMLTAGGQVYQETSDHHLDDGSTWVERDIVMAPISPAGPLGWHRVKDLSMLGTSVTDHDLEVSFARDYATTYEQTKTFPAGSPVTEVGPLEKARVTLKVQKRQAVQIRIRDLEPSSGTVGTGDGPSFEALMLRVGVKPGVAKTSSEQQG